MKKIFIFLLLSLLMVGAVFAAFGPGSAPSGSSSTSSSSSSTSTSSSSSSGGSSSSSGGGVIVTPSTSTSSTSSSSSSSSSSSGGEEQEEEVDTDPVVETDDGELGTEVSGGKQNLGVGNAISDNLKTIVLDLSWLWIALVAVIIAVVLGIWIYRRSQE